MTLWTIQTIAAWNELERLKLECPADRVLLSDYSLWHYVLNYWYLPSSEADGDAFERDIALPFEEKSIQATLWEITIDHGAEWTRRRCTHRRSSAVSVIRASVYREELDQTTVAHHRMAWRDAQMSEELNRHIVADPSVMGGKPVIRGTRISVETILEKVAAGESVDQIVSEHPYITAEHVRAALEYAASVFKNDVVYEVGA